MESTQSFWDKRQILYSNVAIAITHGLMHEKPNQSFCSAMLHANFVKLLGQNYRQGLSLPQCLRLCNSKELYSYDADLLSEYKVYSEWQLMKSNEKLTSDGQKDGTLNGMKMPDVKAVKIFEDIKVLNEVLENPGFLMTPQTAPKKFEMVQESLKSGMVMAKMKSEELMITGCSDDELISVEKGQISREEFNENATEACFANDFRMFIFQDFSVKNNSSPSKAALIVEFLIRKRKPVMVGMRIDGFLDCVIIVSYSKDFLDGKRWTKEGESSFRMKFDDFNENAIEAYFFDNKSPSSKTNYLKSQGAQPTEMINWKRHEITETMENKTGLLMTSTIRNEFCVQEAATRENHIDYYDSVIFKKSEGLEYNFSPGTKLDYPELVLHSNFVLSEAELTRSLEKNVKIEAGASYPSGLQLTGGLDITSGVTRRIVYKRSEDKKPIFVSSAQNANQSNPSKKEFWGLAVRNQTPNAIIPKLTALSLYIMVGGRIIEQKFPKDNFLIKCWKSFQREESPKIFNNLCSNKKALKRIARQYGDTLENEYKIKDRELLLFEEWPGNENCQGFLFCLKFIAAEAKNLYCGLVRAASPNDEEKLLLEFNKLL